MSIADFENMMTLDQPINSKKLCRWERKAQQQSLSDRFIPNRAGMEKSTNSFTSDDSCIEENPELAGHSKLLSDNLNETGSSRVLAYKNKAPAPCDDYQNSLKVMYSQTTAKRSDVVKSTRHISSAPVKILDAPNLLDDYYLNLLSWGGSNTLAVALQDSVFLWEASTGSINELLTLPGEEDYVSSVAWIQHGGNHLALGTSNNEVQLWDVEAQKALRTMRGHSGRVGSLAWNNHILTSGSKDTTILNHDVRVQNHIVGSMTNHCQEVCGLAWSPDGSYLASGANDNKLCIYNASATLSRDAQPCHVLTEHQAAVKALAWSPHERNLLASGGGTADRCIKFWNAQSGSLINSIDTGSQVCALQWSPYEKELLSSHGYAENQLCLWNYPSMVKTKELKGHTSRVLHMAVSPESGMVCSGAADETLRFWNVFASEGKRKGDSADVVNSLSRSSNLKIR